MTPEDTKEQDEQTTSRMAAIYDTLRGNGYIDEGCTRLVVALAAGGYFNQQKETP